MINTLNNKLTKTRCESCQNEKICKFSDDFKQLIEKVEGIEIDFTSPFSISADCNKYKSNLVGEIREHIGWNN